MNAVTLTRDVILRDGTTLRLRPPTVDDEQGLIDFFTQLSDESRYLRFHGFPRLTSPLVAPMLDPDWDERGSLIGELGDRVVAIASYVRLREAAAAEIAFAVDDQLQGRGVGTRLLEQLAEAAAEHGIERFVAEVLAENSPMLAVFRDAGFGITRSLDHGEVEVRLAIEPTEQFLSQVAARDHLAVTASLRPFFEPKSVAVVGASPRRGSIGGELFRNVLAAEFAGAAYPVNRDGSPVAGVRGYKSVADIPERVDLAIFCLPAVHVLSAAEEAMSAGVRALCVISAGFAEIGGEGVERQEQLLSLARSHGARIVGPNCLGIWSSAVSLNGTFAPRAFPGGSLAFSSQSGALGLAALERTQARGLGLSSFVSIGNKADVSTNDLLQWWEDDPDTKVVLLYVESFGNPRAFARIAQRLGRAKPVLAMKSGTSSSGRRAASSHTAALAGSETAVDALFQHTGVIRARTLDELIDVATLLYSQPVPAGNRVAIVTNAGGLGILCADACEAAALTLPSLGEETQRRLREVLPAEASIANPIDMIASASPSNFETVLSLVLADPGIDAAIALFVPTVGADEEAIGAAISAGAATAPEKTSLCSFISGRGSPATLRVPFFPYPEAAARALGRAVERSTWLRRPAGSFPELEVDRHTAESIVAEAGDRWLRPEEARRLLTAYGISIVDERVADSAEAAAAAADELGYPAVVKSAVPGAHKTETGGIALNLATGQEVREAAERIGSPVLVQPYVSGGAELLAGVVQDPAFGPLVAFGPGGVLAELIGDASFRLAPLTDVDARELVTTGKAGRLVAGFRGPAADADALADLLLRLSRLAEDLPSVAELDLNPILALPDRCVAVDARVRIARPEPRHALKTW
jgi:acetyl coenzyme A synthetase (ADP forming)-like protein